MFIIAIMTTVTSVTVSCFFGVYFTLEKYCHHAMLSYIATKCEPPAFRVTRRHWYPYTLKLLLTFVWQTLISNFFFISSSQCKNLAGVLEKVIESQLEQWITENQSPCTETRETIYTLTYLYLNKLSQQKETQDGGLETLVEQRPNYLDSLPPFGPDFSGILSPQHVSPPAIDSYPKSTLKKLQVNINNNFID